MSGSRGIYPWQAETMYSWSDALLDLAEARIDTDIDHLGGGMQAIRVPLSEDGERYVLFGTGTVDDPEPFWVNTDGPEDVIGGCAYWQDDDDPSGYLFAMLSSVNIAEAGGIVAAVRRLMAEAVMVPREKYESC